MTPAPRVRSLVERLALYRRYATVVGAQGAALEAGDLDRFSELNITRRSIEAEVDAIRADASVGLNPETVHLVAEAADALRRAQAGHRQIEERLRGMKDEARRQITGTEARKDGLRRYLAGAGGRPSIDVRS